MSFELQKNDIIELTIDDLGYRGEGIGHCDRIPVFITGALVGERVRAMVILVKKDFVVGKLLQVLQSSPSRVEPKCEVFGKCGGCDLQHLDYGSQLEFKLKQVENALRKIAGMTDVNMSKCVPSDLQYAYRNKLSVPVRSVLGVTKVGFFACNSHRVVEVKECPLQSNSVNRALAIFSQWAKGQSAYDEEKKSGAVRHLSVREIGEYLTITVVATRRLDLTALDELIRAEFSHYALYLNINKAHNNVIFGDKTVLAFGREEKTVTQGITHEVNPIAFKQVNDNVAEKIYTAAAEILRSRGARKVLDAYCGSGVLSAILSKTADSVTGVEIIPEAIASAEKLKHDLKLNNVNFICGDCAKIIPELCDPTTAKSFDTILLDPPRSGCADEVTAAVNNSGAFTVLYISCNPSTLARDLTRLANYRIDALIPFDMFPQTKHVETLCCLRRDLVKI